MKTRIRKMTHVDYAEMADSAERGKEWSQAAELWQKASDAADGLDERHDYYEHREECLRRIAIDGQLDAIAQKFLRIETLEERKADHLDFHEVAAWTLRDALRAAYEAGYDAKK